MTRESRTLPEDGKDAERMENGDGRADKFRGTETERTNEAKGGRSRDSIEEEAFVASPRGLSLFGSFWSTTSRGRKVPPLVANFFTPSAPDTSPVPRPQLT